MEYADERESLNVAEYLWLLRRGKWIILSFVVLSVAISIYITAHTTPIYRASATFIFSTSSSMSRTLDMPGVYWFEIDTAKNNQIQIITSRSMAEAITDSILRSHESDSIVSILYSGSPPSGPGLRGSLVDFVRGCISVSVRKDTDFFVLSAVGYSPESSALMANLAVQTYYRYNLLDARGENREVREFLEEQLVLMEIQLSDAENELMDYKEDNGYIDLDTETRQLVTSLSNFESQAEAARTSAGALSATRSYLLAQLEDSRAVLASDLENLNSTYISQLQSDIARLESARASLLASGVEESNSALIELENDIETRRVELAGAIDDLTLVRYPNNPTVAVERLVTELSRVEADLRGEYSREAALRSLVAAMEISLGVLPEAERNLVRYERNMRVSENLYYLLRNQFEEIRIAEAGLIGNVTIVDSALPGDLIKPSKRRNLIMGLVVGLALGIGTVFLREQIDTTIKNPEAIEALGIPVLGVIPRMNRAIIAKSLKEKSKLITVGAPRAPISEAYRDLRTSLRFADSEKQAQTLLITSAGPREGKSTTAANLAVVMAQTGLSVLLVDTDLRRPVIHQIFSVNREPGFAECISGLNSLGEAVRKSSVENLSLLTSGHIPHNPSELLGSKKVGKFIKLVAERYDVVIFDSPPIAVVTDAILLSATIDETLLVVGAHLANRKVLQSAWTKLKRTSSTLPGAVLNGFDPLTMYTSYGYYTYRYNYYYTDDNPMIRKRIPVLHRKKRKK